MSNGSKIGNFSHISTGVISNGETSIGNNTFIGSGSILNQGIKIRGNVVIGSGSTVIADLNQIGTFTGIIK